MDAWLATGANIDVITGFLRDWLGRRRTVGCLEFVAAALAHAGLRRHLEVLDVAVDNEDRAVEIRLDVAFAIRRRSLA